MKFVNVFLILLLLLSCNKPTPKVPAENVLTSKIDAYLDKTVEHLKLPGLTVAVTRNDSVIYTGAFGYTNIETKKPMKPENIFHWASVSKTFVATAIMQLWEQKKIDLDEKLVTYLPYFQQKSNDFKTITIRQMLNHTSGIGDVDDYEWEKPQYDSGALERFVKSIAHDEMLFAPGKDLRYSNTAYEALGDVIAKVSGVSFETYIRRNIFDPLEMNVTSFLYPEIPDSLRTTGHLWAGDPIISQHYPYNRMHGPSSTLNTNVIEMTHYAFAHLHRGQYKNKRILADATYDLWWKNSVQIEGKPHIGFAWWLGDRDGVKTVSHSGGDTGFRSHFMLAPEKNISVMLVSNYELIDTEDVANGMLDILLNREPEPVARQIGFSFAEIMKAQGLDAAKAFVKKVNGDSLQRTAYIWEEDQGAFTYPGYLLLEQKIYPDAIEVFKFNLEQFPTSAWAHSHLASGYAESGDKEKARNFFRKAIELSPDEKHFKEQLKKLGK